MSFPLGGRSRNSNGSAAGSRKCCYENCSSRSYLYKDKPEHVSFIRFPQPCVKYRTSLPGSAFRGQHKRGKCKQCRVAARWVRKCQRPPHFVSIDDVRIRRFTHICSKHFSSVENARLYREDPRPILSGAKIKKRLHQKSRLKANLNEGVNDISDDKQADMAIDASENDDKSIASFNDNLIEKLQLVVEETNSSSKVEDSVKSSIRRTFKRSYSCKLIGAPPKRLSEKLKELQQLNGGVNTTSDADIVENKSGTLTKKLQRLQQLTSNNLFSDYYAVEIDNTSALNWKRLALKFLESKWAVQLNANGITLLQHHHQFITMEITITKQKIVVSVRGRILELPDNLRHMNSSEDSIVKVVSILENCNICQGSNPKEMVNIERDLKSCWSPKCACVIFDKGSNVFPSCQQESEIPDEMKGAIQKTFNYRFMGKRELMFVIKENKKMLKQMKLKLYNLKRKLNQASMNEHRLCDANKIKEQNPVVILADELPDAQPKRLSEKLKQLQQLNNGVNMTSDADLVVDPKKLSEQLKELMQNKGPKRGTITEKLQRLQQLSGDNSSSDSYTVDNNLKGKLSEKLKLIQQKAARKAIETSYTSVLNWRSLAMRFLESKWTVQLKANGITLLKHHHQFITMAITITKLRIVVSVRGRILTLPDSLKHTNSSEDSIVNVVSNLENCHLCQGTNPKDMVTIERDLKSCWSRKCAGLLFDKGRDVCPSCQHECEIPEVTKETLQKNVNYRFMGKRELVNLIKETRLKVADLQRKLELASEREQLIGDTILSILSW